MRVSHDISLKIEELKALSGESYITTVVNYVEENELEYTMLSKLINSTLKQKLEAEFQALNYLPKANSMFQ